MQDRMHICFVTDAFPPSIGGVQFHTYELVKHISKLGHKVTVITHNLPNAEEKEVIEDNIEVRRLKGRVLYFGGHDEAIDFRMIGQFKRILKQGDSSRKKFDAVYGQSLLSFLVFGCLYTAYREGIPTIITKCSIIEQHRKTRIFAKLYLHILVPFLNKFTAVKVITEGSKQELPRLKIPVIVIPHGVDTSKWYPKPKIRQETREQLGYKPDDIVIGYLGRFVARKGALQLVKIVSSLIKKRVAATFRLRILLIGEGPLMSTIKQEIKKTGLKEHFILTGYKSHNETPAYYNAMDIFAFPTYGEAFGIVLTEAMACGIPPVTMNNWGTKDIITDGENGFLANSIEQFEERLTLLINNQEVRKKLGQNAHKKMERDFSWDVSAKKTIEMLNAKS